MSETWKPIPGWEGAYEVSDQGRVRSLPRAVRHYRGGASRRGGRILRPGVVRDYERVVLQRDGRTKNVAVHRLVLTAFIGPCPPGMEACHGDGNRRNNRLSNLRWDTKAANCRDRTTHGGSPNARKTHCPQGHPYTPENTYMSAGSRKCRVCHIRRSVEGKRRRRQARKEAKA